MDLYECWICDKHISYKQQGVCSCDQFDTPYCIDHINSKGVCPVCSMEGLSIEANCGEYTLMNVP